VSPDIREELDFIVKPIDRMLDQLSYRDIHEKIASKILYESYFLMGRVDIYQALINHLESGGTKDLIETDFETALQQRKDTNLPNLTLYEIILSLRYGQLLPPCIEYGRMY